MELIAAVAIAALIMYLGIKKCGEDEDE
jgi:hypothetical protein